MLKDLEQVQHEEYAVMWKRERIGTFIEDRLENSYLTVNIKLDMNKKDKWPLMLSVLQEDGNISWINTLFFVRHRVTPPYQDGIENKLKQMGMHEYDEYTIFRDGNGFKCNDFLWVAFRDDLTFDNTHPRAWKIQ